jgi:hypothetical protein
MAARLAPPFGDLKKDASVNNESRIAKAKLVSSKFIYGISKASLCKLRLVPKLLRKKSSRKKEKVKPNICNYDLVINKNQHPNHNYK